MILSSRVFARKCVSYLILRTWIMLPNIVHYTRGVIVPIGEVILTFSAFSFSCFLWISSLLTIKEKFANQVCFGGGKRPRRPRAWKTKNRRGSYVKSQKLVDLIATLPSTKEAVYGGLDTWVAWEIEFPVITIKKALCILRDQEEWKRVIQVL